MVNQKKVGLVGTVKIVCRNKNGNIKWQIEATDEEVKR